MRHFVRHMCIFLLWNCALWDLGLVHMRNLCDRSINDAFGHQEYGQHRFGFLLNQHEPISLNKCQLTPSMKLLETYWSAMQLNIGQIWSNAELNFFSYRCFVMPFGEIGNHHITTEKYHIWYDWNTYECNFVKCKYLSFGTHITWRIVMPYPLYRMKRCRMRHPGA